MHYVYCAFKLIEMTYLRAVVGFMRCLFKIVDGSRSYYISSILMDPSDPPKQVRFNFTECRQIVAHVTDLSFYIYFEGMLLAWDLLIRRDFSLHQSW